MDTGAQAHNIKRWQSTFTSSIKRCGRAEPILVLTHNDADGLSAGAILERALIKASRRVETRILGRGENPWTESVQRELRQQNMSGLIVSDLGTRSQPVLLGTPTIIIDHHFPLGIPTDATVISGYGIEPTPTSGLLAWWCAQQLTPAADLLWLAAISIIGDLGEKSEFSELAVARSQYGMRTLRDAASLLNAARRASLGDAHPAFALLLKANTPHDVTSGVHSETKYLLAAKQEVKKALEKAKRIAPKIKGNVALIRLDSPCQVHPLIAQIWRARLKKQIVIVANIGFQEDWVHFSVRSATGTNLIEFLKQHAPVGTDESYGSGHEQATGGALRHNLWNDFVSGLGFGPEMQV